jgi:hypothetical protein
MDVDVIEIRIADDVSQNPERLNRAVLALRRELLGLECVSSADQAASPAPRGAKSGVIIDIATLLVGVRYSAPALKEISGFFGDWLRRNDGKRVIMKLKDKEFDITGMSEKEISRLIETDAGKDAAGQ